MKKIRETNDFYLKPYGLCHDLGCAPFYGPALGRSIPKTVEKGHATSAPEHPYIGLKLLITSVASALLWVEAYLNLKN